MVRMVAGLGGFLNRKHDGFPGSQTLWIGLQRAADFVMAMDAQRGLGAGIVCNSQRSDLRTATPVNLPSKPLRQAGDTLWEAPGC